MLEAIDTVAVPVLLVWGDQDQLVQREVIDHGLERRPNWQLRVLKSACPAAPLGVPDAYARAVRGWLTQPDPTERNSDGG